jgi:hypothetical protein
MGMRRGGGQKTEDRGQRTDKILRLPSSVFRWPSTRGPCFFFNSDYTHSQRYVSDAMGKKGMKPRRIVYV